ncbi:MAG: helix-turn-helix domain-containing protein [archaeon]
MFKFSFKVRHKDCSETGLSLKFPQHHITVIDIQSKNPKEKQYLYYISGNLESFCGIVDYLKKTKTYKMVKEIERSSDTLLLLVVLYQTGYVQNVIQEYHGFFIDLHTVVGGYEYWHVGVLDRKNIEPMRKRLASMGELKVLFIGKVDFAHTLLSKQQKKVFSYAFDQGYFESPRKTTIEEMAKALGLSTATVGEHLLKAENKLIHTVAKKTIM